jgi:hypothetical protein
MYYHDGGDATVAGFVFLSVGFGLVFISFFTALGYAMIRLGATLKLKGSNVN